MATLRGQEATRLQNQFEKGLTTKDLKKYRDVAPQLVSDDVLFEIIHKCNGDDIAIFAAIEDLWHDISDERAVQGNEWETSERGKKAKKKPESYGQSERSSGRGRGKSAPPRGGRGGGRGLSSSRGEHPEGRSGRSKATPAAAPTSTTFDVPNEWGEAAQDNQNYTTEDQSDLQDAAPDNSLNTVKAQESSIPAWSSNGLSFAQQLKLKEEQKKQAAILAAQQQQQLQHQQQQRHQNESSADQGELEPGALSHEGRPQQRSRNRRGNKGRSRTRNDDAGPSHEDNSASQEDQGSLELDPRHVEAEASVPPPDATHQQQQMDLSSLSEAISHLSSAPLDDEPPALTTSSQHLESVVASSSPETSIPAEMDVSQLQLVQETHSHTHPSHVPISTHSQHELDSSPKPYLKLGKWEATLESADRSAFQFGSFGSFADDSSAPDWGVSESLANNLTQDESSMDAHVWSSVGVSSDNLTQQSQNNDTGLHKLEDASRFVDGKTLADIELSKQQSLQRPQTSGVLPRKTELDTVPKAQSPQQTTSQPQQQIQQQQLQQQQQFQQQQQQPQQYQQHNQIQSPQANGAPPGLQQPAHMGGGRGVQPQGQVPYYGLDMGYIHPGYAPVSSPVAAVGAISASTGAAAGTTSTHTNTAGALQQQQPYPSPPPGMAAMGPYGAAAYNPYFYNQPGYYYGNATAPNFYGRGGQAMYQPPRGPYVSEPYPQPMGGGLYPTDMYGQPAMGGQFADSLYGGAMGMHGGQGGHQGGGPGAVGGGGKGGKGASGGGGVSQAPVAQDHGHNNNSYGYANPNPYSHASRDAQAAAAQQWSSYQQPSPGWNQQMMQQQQQFQHNVPGGAGAGFSQQSSMPQGRHDGGGSRGSGASAGSYGQGYGGNRGPGAAGSGAQGGNHQPTW